MFASGQLKDGEMYDVDHSRTGWGDYLKTQKQKSCKSCDLQDFVRREREIEYYNEIDHNRL